MTKEEVLQECTIDGNNVKLPEGQLDRKLYQDVAKSLQGIGGKWIGGKTQAFVFDQDPTELLTRINGGEQINLKKDFQFFETPELLADELVLYAAIQDHHIVLEPSAGRGAIVDEIFRRFPNKEYLFCIEKMDDNLRVLHKKYSNKINIIHPLNDDFLNYTGSSFDRIVANPPFTNNQDIDHVRKMYEILSPGGRLVSVTSEHWRMATNEKKCIAFSGWLVDVDAAYYRIDKGAFKSSGTMVGGNIIVIDKPN